MSNAEQTQTPENLAPLLLKSDEAARMCGRSYWTWRKLHREGACPAPVMVGAVEMWRAEDLKTWVAAGCPKRTLQGGAQ